MCANTKIDGRKGMVLFTYKYWAGVDVRFAVDAYSTNTSLLGSDRDIDRSPYTTMLMYDFELEPYE